VDRRTDVFCLGIVLWECLTGERLFDGGTDVGKIDAVRSKKIVPTSVVRPDVPLELDEIVMRCLSRDMNRRYQTALDLSEALERFLGRLDHRPNAKNIGLWLESLFGVERSALKKAIGQGSEVESALERLQSAGVLGTSAGPTASSGRAPSQPGMKPRALWSTRLGRGSSGSWPTSETSGSEVSATPVAGSGPAVGRNTRPSSPSFGAVAPPVTSEYAPVALPDTVPGGAVPAQGRRTLVLLSGVAVAATLAIAGYSIRAEVRRPAPGSTAATAPELGVLDLRSQPAGAHVLVDGNPTGMTTPAVLSGLPLQRPVEIRLDLPGYAPVVSRLEARVRDKAAPQTFQLTAVSGTIVLRNLPPRAAVFLDGEPVDGDGPIAATVGNHELRVDTKTDVLFAETIDVQPGEQVVSVRKRKAEP
jgi:serine/threonine-protein kinase